MPERQKIESIRYKAGYKYQLFGKYSVMTNIIPPGTIATDFVNLDFDGTLCIQRGYAWDGPSGPAIHTPTFMRGSLVHDALYQLMREGFLDCEEYREQADDLLKAICLEDGMTDFRAWWVHQAIRLFGAQYAG